LDSGAADVERPLRIIGNEQTLPFRRIGSEQGLVPLSRSASPTTKIGTYNPDVDISAIVGILFHTNRVILPEPCSDQRLSYL
jgi:hypothetical protein